MSPLTAPGSVCPTLCSLLPISPSPGQKDGAIRAPGILGLRSYRFSERSGSLPGELLQQPDWLTRPQTQAEQDYLQTESVYRAFVYDTYLDVDPGPVRPDRPGI